MDVQKLNEEVQIVEEEKEVDKEKIEFMTFKEMAKLFFTNRQYRRDCIQFIKLLIIAASFFMPIVGFALFTCTRFVGIGVILIILGPSILFVEWMKKPITFQINVHKEKRK